MGKGGSQRIKQFRVNVDAVLWAGGAVIGNGVLADMTVAGRSGETL